MINGNSEGAHGAIPNPGWKTATKGPQKNGVDKATTTPFSTRNGQPTRVNLAGNETPSLPYKQWVGVYFLVQCGATLIKPAPVGGGRRPSVACHADMRMGLFGGRVAHSR